MIYQKLTLRLLQLNSSVNDIDYNYKRIESSLENNKSDICIYPELFLTGYSIDKYTTGNQMRVLVNKYVKKIKELSKSTDSTLIIGAPYYRENNTLPYNSAYIIQNGKILGIYNKRYLPNYELFFENRYYVEGNRYIFLRYNKCNIWILICEDIWKDNSIKRVIIDNRISLLIVINSSPYTIDKDKRRRKLLYDISSQLNTYIVYLNGYGGEDEFIVDGGSMIYKDGKRLVSLPYFQESIKDITIYPYVNQELNRYFKNTSLIRWIYREDNRCTYLKEIKTLYKINKNDITVKNIDLKYLYQTDQYSNKYLSDICASIIVSIHDYIFKHRLQKVIIGISGGLDSLLVLLFTIEAIDISKIEILLLPSKYSLYLHKSIKLINLLNVSYKVINIDSIIDSFNEKQFFKKSISLENIQSRIRSNILLTVSNEINGIVLNTANKSEIAMGYITIGGDTSGAYAPLKDLYKSDIYSISRYFISKKYKNIFSTDHYKFISSFIDQEPSAELRSNQSDREDIGDYKLIDPIIEDILSMMDYKSIIDKYTHKYKSFKLSSKEDNSEYIKSIINRVINNEYKRKIIPIGPTITKTSLNSRVRIISTKPLIF